ncbi:peptide methionine sulfoxide reductase [Chelonus insularis]|uniref:peptide methionine sulfoxide reductase n=1 Tax=Chelonus insularis TaxID=460826 RepID=UPI00158D1DB9|nr:peptide methionine sulfoxide reductase [Chelonus insularis]XP_034933920.1 peptide methionine sulfoxide reductase [Chelonus insularis]
MPGEIEETKTKRATFGMGCFWACDALFGVTPGVIRTCVGYAGGTQPTPTYKKIGDHTEVIDIEYDPEAVSFNQLLTLFWNNHEYGLTRKIKTQYASLILYHDDEQMSIAEKSRDHEQRERGEVLATTIRKFENFYPAEDYHQKYRLQLHSFLVDSLGLTSSELRTSSLAARLNGYVAGAASIEQFENDPLCQSLNEKQYQYVKKHVIENQGNGLYC